MTAIEITTETPTEMYCLLNLVRKMEVENREPVPEMQKKRILPGEMPAVAGLGEAPSEGSQTEEVERFVEDLRKYAELISGTMTVPPDLMCVILKAARVIEIECTRREHHRLGDYANDKRILDVIRKP